MYSLSPIMNIFFGMGIRETYRQSPPIALVVLNDFPINFRLRKYTFLYVCTFIFYLCAYDVFVAIFFEIGNVIVIHQTRVCHYNEIV